MSARHAQPSLLRRINTPTRGKVAAVGIGAGVVLLAGVIGGAISLGNDWSPRAAAAPTLPPLSDDPGQRGMRGLPTPARIFPTDQPVPHYDPEPIASPLYAPRSAPPPSARIPGPPKPSTGLSAGSPTPTEPPPVTPEPEPVAPAEPEPPIDVLPGIPDNSQTEPDTEEEPMPEPTPTTEPAATDAVDVTEEVAGP